MARTPVPAAAPTPAALADDAKASGSGVKKVVAAPHQGFPSNEAVSQAKLRQQLAKKTALATECQVLEEEEEAKSLAEAIRRVKKTFKRGFHKWYTELGGDCKQEFFFSCLHTSETKLTNVSYGAELSVDVPEHDEI
eukprot:2245462-Pyramimonas_sp.AAC.1